MKQPFNSITPQLISQRKAVHEVCRQFSRSPSKGNLKRVKVLFQSCGESVIIESGIHMDYGYSISVGDRVYININCTMLDGFIDPKNDVPKYDESNEGTPSLSSTPSIVIGDDCFIGPNVQLLAVSHDIESIQRKEQKLNYVERITLGHNVWLGGGVIVLGGVNIGENSVIGAGSVVTKNVDANSFYAGNPAVKIRNL